MRSTKALENTSETGARDGARSCKMLKFAATFLPLSNLVRVDFESRLAFLSGLLDHRRSIGPVVPLGFLLRMSKYSGSSAPG